MSFAYLALILELFAMALRLTTLYLNLGFGGSLDIACDEFSNDGYDCKIS